MYIEVRDRSWEGQVAAASGNFGDRRGIVDRHSGIYYSEIMDPEESDLPISQPGQKPKPIGNFFSEEK